MTILRASSMKSGDWNHYIDGVFDDSQGSWFSNEDGSYKGFWETTSSWREGKLGTADIYLDSNLNGIWDYSDELIGYAQGFWDGDYDGGSWNRIESFKYGYFGGSAFGQFNITSEMSFDGTENDDAFAGSSRDDFIRSYGGNDVIYSGKGDDDIHAFRGADTISGGAGNDILRAGNGRDILTGGDGADVFYGGFGLNTFEDELDGEIDQLYFRSDQWAENWLYGSAGNSPNGEKADKIEMLDEFDQIYVQGVETSQLSYGFVDHNSNLGETLSGIGIYASGALEAVYVGGNLSMGQIASMTQGIL